MTKATDVPNNVSSRVQSYVSSPVNPSKSPRLTISEKFQSFHERNPHILELIIEAARRRKDAGMSYISMKGIFEELRIAWNAQTNERPYKLSNSYTAEYARLLPSDLAPLFVLRSLRRQTQVVGRSQEPLTDAQSPYPVYVVDEAQHA